MEMEEGFDKVNRETLKHKDTNKYAAPAIPRSILALNALAPYYTMFPIQFPITELNKANRTDWVLDPFCGRGTTVYAARSLGLNSVGLDNDPVAIAITKAKLVNSTPNAIMREMKNIMRSQKYLSVKTPEGEFWDLAYEHETLISICHIRNSLLNDCTSETRIALRGLMLGALHGPLGKYTQSYFSNQMPRTYTTKPNSAIRFWKKNNLKPMRINVLKVIERRATRFYSTLPVKTKGNAYLQDSRRPFKKKVEKKFKWIITSPPYLGMNDYGINQWIREWFVGGPEYPDYRTNNRLGSGSIQKFEQDLISVWKNVSDLCEKDASLVIRIGSLPSKPYDFEELIKKSLDYSGSEWTVERVIGAGFAEDGHRQSKQFFPSIKSAMEEIDVYANKVS